MVFLYHIFKVDNNETVHEIFLRIFLTYGKHLDLIKNIIPDFYLKDNRDNNSYTSAGKLNCSTFQT